MIVYCKQNNNKIIILTLPVPNIADGLRQNPHFCVLGSHQALLRVYFWLYVKGSFWQFGGGPYIVLGIELVGCIQSKLLPTVLSLYPRTYIFLLVTATKTRFNFIFCHPGINISTIKEISRQDGNQVLTHLRFYFLGNRKTSKYLIRASWRLLFITVYSKIYKCYCNFSIKSISTLSRALSYKRKFIKGNIFLQFESHHSLRRIQITTSI